MDPKYYDFDEGLFEGNMADYLQHLLELQNNGSKESAVKPPRDVANYDYYYLSKDIATLLKPWTKDSAFWPTAITYGLTFILGIMGNILVVFSLVVDRKARNVTSYFLISLAMADLAFLLICVPYEALLELNTTWAGGTALCKIAGFVEMLSACASVINLMAVSIERYIVIVHPIKSRSWCTIGNTKRIIVAVWIIAILMSAPLLHTMDTTTSMYYTNVTYAVVVDCAEYNIKGPNDKIVFSYYQLIVMFIFPIIVMIFCYSLVIRVLWSSTKELARMTSTNHSKCLTDDESLHKRLHVTTRHYRGRVTSVRTFVPRSDKDHALEVREARKQVIKMLLAIIGVFFLCWGPKLVFNILKRHELTFLHSDSAFYTGLVINLLPYLHSCLNPIIYSFMSKNYRRSMRTACRSYCRDRCHRNRRQHRSSSMDTVSKHEMGNSPSMSTKSATKPCMNVILTASTNC